MIVILMTGIGTGATGKERIMSQKGTQGGKGNHPGISPNTIEKWMIMIIIPQKSRTYLVG
jgi:hypothetical protein